jgi:hypothetical protein
MRFLADESCDFRVGARFGLLATTLNPSLKLPRAPKTTYLPPWQFMNSGYF